MKDPYQVVDLFAGPGGLAEGFSSVVDGGVRSFEIALSVEMEASAHRTLTLRAFTRQFPPRQLPESYYRFVNGEKTVADLQAEFPQQWKIASDEALRLELGSTEATETLIPRIDNIRKLSAGRTVLIGGPPCQAYSLVGRSRNAGKDDYVPEEDGRHFLYREYIRILERLRPAAFVMENVKGIISSSVSGDRIFQRILEDLRDVGIEEGGYRLLALTPDAERKEQNLSNPSPRDFIVRAENHGIPQKRHRVFVIGLRADVADSLEFPKDSALLPKGLPVSVRDAIGGMPQLRSGLSGQDDEDEWQQVVGDAASELIKLGVGPGRPEVMKLTSKTLRSMPSRTKRSNARLPRIDRSYDPAELTSGLTEELAEFLTDNRLQTLANHESRGHMKTDLARYLFCAAFAEANGRSAKAIDFPEELAPDHQNWRTGKFADRFRVQTWDAPSTTITSHISKDGHYYIHPDPAQCRSLTVREAARLQTFPDNYVFLGNRTQQYVQVGNAVPPFLAKKIAEALIRLLP